MAFGEVFRGKRVVVTGHTGFKGAWLCEWLLSLGAQVTGIALPPATQPSLFDQLGLASRVTHVLADIRDQVAIETAIATIKPDFVFHLAAQPLVRLSYREPVATFATNIMGTAHLLEAIRALGAPCVVVAITTDKCYENREWVHAYREEDPLGGHDPYSASKGAAEIVISSYRRSFFPGVADRVRIASARAGNVIGGGDWALDRIVPDCVRALRQGRPIPVRNRVATRPWQHVLEPLSGYLWLASRLATASPTASCLASAFNFGPGLSSNRTVLELVQEILKFWPGAWEDRSDPHAPHEAGKLNLATDKAYHLLRWQPVWSFEDSIAHTAAWYRAHPEPAGDAREFTLRQIRDYTEAAQAKRLDWATDAGCRA